MSIWPMPCARDAGRVHFTNRAVFDSLILSLKFKRPMRHGRYGHHAGRESQVLFTAVLR